ncbi:MAG: hypothetical protein KAV87_67880 [Desulfobacteraceae bacterium]|nr:hypothetical protein [Desulfobacteraceae bacterium]
MSKPVSMLTGYKTNEVSIVDRAANKRRFALTKSESKSVMKIDSEILDAVMSTPAEGEDALIEVLKSAGADEDAMGAAVVQFRMQKGFKDIVPDEHFAAVSKAAGYVAKADEKKPEKKNPFAEKGKKKKMDEEDVKKGLETLAPEVRGTIEALFKSNKQASEENSELKAVVKSLVDSQEERSYIAKAEKQFDHVPGTSKEIGMVLKSAHNVSSEFGKNLESIFGKMNDVAKSSPVFKNMGSAGGDINASGGGDSWEQIKKAAVSHFAKSADGATMSAEQAVAKFLETPEGAELYKAYEADNPVQFVGRR